MNFVPIFIPHVVGHGHSCGSGGAPIWYVVGALSTFLVGLLFLVFWAARPSSHEDLFVEGILGFCFLCCFAALWPLAWPALVAVGIGYYLRKRV